MPDDELALQLKALGDATRIQILTVLPNTCVCDDVYNVSELAEELGIPQPTVSHHLRILFQAKLVKSKKMCRDVYYWVDEEAINQAMLALHAVVAHRGPRDL